MGKHWDEEWLREKYTEDLLTTEEIADKVGVDSNTIRRYLHKFDIDIIHRYERERRKGDFEACKKREYFYQLPKWKRTAKEVRERDGYECLSCGKKQSDKRIKLHVHHIAPLKKFTKENGEVADGAFDKSNLISLCGSCHGKWENVPVRPQFDS